MSEERRRDAGYLQAKLEGIETALAALAAQQAKANQELDTLREQIREYTAQWRAVRWLGAIVIALVLAIKTGSIGELRSLFGGGA